MSSETHLTPEILKEIEQIALQEVIRQSVGDAIDEGILIAVEMMRIAVKRYPHLTVSTVADLIEQQVSEKRAKEASQ